MNEDTSETDVTEGSAKKSAPVWFWVISVVGLLWYLMDTSGFFMRVFMTEGMINKMPENQQHLYRNMPIWVNMVFAAEVSGGLLGCIGLLLRKPWALPLFYLSIVGVLSQTFYVFFLSDAISVMAAPAIMMPLVAIVISVVMIVLAKTSISKGWLGYE